MENPDTRPSPNPQPPPPPRPVAEPTRKTPALAAIVSFIPGLGNVYNGLYRRAVMFFLAFVSLFTLALNSGDEERAFLVPCLVFVFFFNVFDAYRQAALINYYGYEPAARAAGNGLEMGGWGLAPGVFLLVLGFWGLMRRYLNIDLSMVIELWPFVLMGFGAWMIYQYFREKKEGEEETVERRMPEA